MKTKNKRGKDKTPHTRRKSLDVILEREHLILINPKVYNILMRFMDENAVSPYIEQLIKNDIINLANKLIEEVNND